jgi:hypothetical protein
MYTAKEIWEGIGTNGRTALIDKYGDGMIPYYLQKPTFEQIVQVLGAAKRDGYLLHSFIEYTSRLPYGFETVNEYLKHFNPELYTNKVLSDMTYTDKMNVIADIDFAVNH